MSNGYKDKTMIINFVTKHYYMVPLWLSVLSVADILIGFGGSAFVIYDILKKKHVQKMKIMNIVWPITVWYLGPFGIYAYSKWGKLTYKNTKQERAFPQKIFSAATHCGAGCTLGDVVAEWLIFFTTLSILGLTLYASYVSDFVFAYALGIVFQYFTIVPMRKKIEGKKISTKEGLKIAIKADSISLISYEVGLFLWMGLT